MQKLIAASSKGPVDLKELGIDGNMESMIEDMEENERVLEEIETPWEEKLAKAKAEKQEAIEAQENQEQQELIEEETAQV